MKKICNKQLSLAVISLLLAQGLWSQETDDSDVYELAAFEVYTSSQVTASEFKRNSNLVGSFLGTDAIGELPDDTLGEALTRLAGVNVVGGDEVSIRGVEGKLNAIRIDGVGMAQSNSGASTSRGSDTRNFDVSSIPADVVDSVEVIKSVTADLDADSVGGFVNVKTATAFTYGERISRYRVEYRYFEQGEQTGLGLSGTYADLLTENLGLLVNVAFREEDSRAWEIEYRQRNTPDDALSELDRFEPRDEKNSDRRFMFSGSLDWRISNTTELFFKPWINLRDREQFRNRIRVRDLDEREGNSRPGSGTEGAWWFMDANGTPNGEWEDNDGDGVLGSKSDNFINARDSDGNIIVTPYKESSDFRLLRQYRARPTRENRQYGITLGGTTELDDSVLSYKLSVSSDTHSYDEIRSIFDQDGGTQDTQRFQYINGNPVFPVVSAVVVTEREGIVPVQPEINVFEAHDRLRLNNLRFNEFESSEDRLIAILDYTNRSLLENWEFKIGAKINKLQRDSFMDLFDWSPSELNVTYADFADDFGEPFEGFDGRYSYMGPSLKSNDSIVELFNATNTGSNWEQANAEEFLRVSTNFYEIDETILAAYAMATGTFGSFTIIGGVRVEDTDQEITWNASKVRAPIVGLNPLQDRSQEYGYTNFFPSLVGVYRMGADNQHVLRAAITTSIARPDYEDLVPFDTAYIRQQWGDIFNTEETVVRNPDLEEQTSVSFDLAWEWYYAPGNSFSLGYFRKELKDFHLPFVFRQEVLVPEDPLDPNGALETATTRTELIVNGAKQSIDGLEVSWIDSLDFLPSILDGFGFVANYTYITGKQEEPIFDTVIFQNEQRLAQTGSRSRDALQGQPENILNLQLYYEKGRFNGRVAYNYVDSFLREIFDVDFETFQDVRETVDLSFQYRFSETFRFFLDVKNLTDEPESYVYQDNKGFPESYSEEGRSWVVGVRGQF